MSQLPPRVLTHKLNVRIHVYTCIYIHTLHWWCRHERATSTQNSYTECHVTCTAVHTGTHMCTLISEKNCALEVRGCSYHSCLNYMYACSTKQSHMHMPFTHYMVLHVTCVPTAASVRIIRFTQLSPYSVCLDLLPSLIAPVQSYDDLRHWPPGEQSTGTIIDIRIRSHT